MTPLVILIDIDGTMIGDITPFVIEWEILKMANKSKLSLLKNKICESLSNGLLRSNLAEFYSNMKKLGNVEFFVYTSSYSEWANFIISCIERTININFNKPIFTRSHCIHHNGDTIKCLQLVSKTIFKRLKPKYPKMNDEEMRKKMILIDNNNVLKRSEMGQLIKCPTYEYCEFYDIFERLGIDNIVKDPVMFKNIHPILTKYGLFPSSNDNNIDYVENFKAYYYKRLGYLIETSAKKTRQKDIFWIKLTNAFINTNGAISDFKLSKIKNVREFIDS